MSMIEDTREEMQDFLAPELRAISARLDAMEKRFDTRFEGVDKRLDGVDKRFDGIDKRLDGIDKRFDRVDRRFDDVEQRAERRHAEVLSAIARSSDTSNEISSMRERLARLEAKDNPHQ